MLKNEFLHHAFVELGYKTDHAWDVVTFCEPTQFDVDEGPDIV